MECKVHQKNNDLLNILWYFMEIIKQKTFVIIYGNYDIRQLFWFFMEILILDNFSGFLWKLWYSDPF